MIHWKNIKDASPPCDGDVVFIGVNSVGFCGCFNQFDPTPEFDGLCIYKTAEEFKVVMSDLLWWSRVDTPNAKITGG